jgi:hypothetical protein
LDVSQSLVSRILRLDTIRSRHPEASGLPDSTILETLGLPAKTQTRVLEAADAHGWTIAQTRAAKKLMTDGHTDEATRESVLSGEIDPAEVHVTVTLDGETSRWARIEAARQDTSISRFVAGLLRERMDRDDCYEQARSSYLAQQPRDLSSGSPTYPSRDKLHLR